MDLCACVSVLLLDVSGREKELETDNTCFKQGYFLTKKKNKSYAICYNISSLLKLTPSACWFEAS